MLEVKIKNKSSFPTPEYATVGSAGFDIKSNSPINIILKPLERMAIPTGLYFEIPSGYEAQVRPRSGLANSNGITVLNSPGTIDSDYRGELFIILVNLSNADYIVNRGDRIAQLVVCKYDKVKLVEVEGLEATVRGTKGLGSSGH